MRCVHSMVPWHGGIMWAPHLLRLCTAHAISCPFSGPVPSCPRECCAFVDTGHDPRTNSVFCSSGPAVDVAVLL